METAVEIQEQVEYKVVTTYAYDETTTRVLIYENEECVHSFPLPSAFAFLLTEDPFSPNFDDQSDYEEFNTERARYLSKKGTTTKNLFELSLFESPLLTPIAEKVLLLRAKLGDTGALHRLTLSNQRFIWKKVLKYTGEFGILPHKYEIQQEVNAFMPNVIDKFNIRYIGVYRFSTYLESQIRGVISEYAEYIYGMPRHEIEVLISLRKWMETLSEDERKLPFRQLAIMRLEAEGADPNLVSAKQRETMIRLRESRLRIALNTGLDRYTSLDREDAFGRPRYDTFVPRTDKNLRLFEDAIILQQDSKTLTEVKRKVREIAERILNPIQLEILLLKFGLNGAPPMTLREIAKEVNMSRQTIKNWLDKDILPLVRDGFVEAGVQSQWNSLN